MAIQSTDPFAAIATPSLPATPAVAPAAAPAAADPFAAIAQSATGTTTTTTTPPPPTSGLGGVVQKYLVGSPEEQAAGWGSPELAGFVKTGGRGLATLVDLISHNDAPPEFAETYRKQKPDATREEIGQAFEAQERQKGGIAGLDASIHHSVRGVANWLKQGTELRGPEEALGAAAEQYLEYETGMRLLRGLGLAAELPELGTKAEQIAVPLGKRIMGVLKGTPQAAAIMGAQGYAHSGDPHQALLDAAIGGVTHVGVGTATEAGRSLLNVSPVKLNIGGEETTALRRQVNEAGKPVEGGAAIAPKIAKEQQGFAQRVMANKAREALAAAFGKINNQRGALTPIENPARLLGAGERTTAQAPAYAYSTSGVMSKGAAAPESGPQTFTFTLQGPPIEERAGEMAQSAAKVPGRAAFKQPQYTTSGTARETFQQGPQPAPAEAPKYVGAEGQIGADIRSAGPPTAARDVTRGFENLHSKDSHKAEAWLQQLDDLIKNPDYEKLPSAQRAHWEDQRKTLNEQLKMYYSSPYARSTFEPADLDGAASQVNTFGDVKTQLHGAAKPIFERLDQLSKGRFNAQKEIAEKAGDVMRNPSSMEAYDRAVQRRADANAEIASLFDSHRSQISFEDYQAGRNAWRQGERMGELHDIFEGMMNGVSAKKAAEEGSTRLMSGAPKRLQRYLDKGTNRAQVEELLGKDGVSNIEDLSILMSNAKTAQVVQDVGKNIFLEYMTQAKAHIPGGVMGLAGGMLGKATGFGWWEGMGAGATVALGTRMVLHSAVTNPRIGKMLEYAARNGISPKVYAPLIARVLAEWSEQQPAETKP